MAILKIKKYPDKILKTGCVKVDKITGRLVKLADSMLETMYFFGGIGLAANQAGELARLVVFDTKPNGECMPVVIFNPEIISADGSWTLEEGCLSFPGISANIKRPHRILLTGISPAEKEIRLELSGMPARVAQHEIDHLNGKDILDRVNPLRRWTLKKEYFKVNNVRP